MTLRSTAARVVLGVVLGLHLLLLVLSIPDYRVTIDSGYHVSLARYYAEHGTAFWDHINFGPGGRPNLQGPALHVLIAVLGRLLGGSGDAYVMANAALAVAQWTAAMFTAVHFAGKIAGDRAALLAGALLAGNAVSASSFANGIPSGWIFILTPWAIDAVLTDRLWLCALITSVSIYFHLGGYVTAPLGVATAALMTGRWRPLVKVGVLTALMTAPFTWHFLRYREWYRGEHGAVAISLAPLIYVTALPGLLWLLRRPRANVLLIAWVAAPIVWLAQDYSRFLTQATLPMAVIAGVCIASVSSRLGKTGRAAVATLLVALSILPSPLNAPSLFGELEWYLGVKYPRVMDWQDAHVVADVIQRAGLTNRLVAAYNPSHGIRYAVYAPIQLEKGHWVEVQPRHDPAEDLSAGVKVYVLPLPADDVDLVELQRRGWLTVYGGGVGSTVVTLTSPPRLDEIVPLALGILADEATWLAANGQNNVLKPVGVRLPQWKATLAAQRQRAGRMEIAAILLAYGLEPTDPTLARELRGVGRGFGSLANFLGDDECVYFVSAERHRLLLANMVTVAESARRAQSEPSQVRKFTATLAVLFQQYFVTA